MNLARTTMSSVEQEHALAGRLAVRKIQLKNNKSPLPAALHLAIQHFLSQNRWPVISAEALTDDGAQATWTCSRHLVHLIFSFDYQCNRARSILDSADQYR